MLDGYQYPYQLVYWRDEDVGNIPESVITAALKYSLKAPNQAAQLSDQVIWLPHRDTAITMTDFTNFARTNFISNSLTMGSIHNCTQAIVFGSKGTVTTNNLPYFIRDHAQNTLLQAYRAAQYIQKQGYCTGFCGKIIEYQNEFSAAFPHLNFYPILILLLGVDGIMAHKSSQKDNIEAMNINDTDSLFDGPLAGDITPDLGTLYYWDHANRTIGAPCEDHCSLTRAEYPNP